jgi:hypothetical protein
MRLLNSPVERPLVGIRNGMRPCGLGWSASLRELNTMSHTPVEIRKPSGEEPELSGDANPVLTAATLVVAIVLLFTGLRMIWSLAHH